MKKKILLLGGSGGLSGCLARLVTERGFEVWTVTRGQRPLPAGVHSICADREREEELTEKLRGLGIMWDAAFDCICMNARHAAWDTEVLPEFTKRLVAVSTDSVYDTFHKMVPQPEESDWYVEDDSYAGNKRKMEEVFLRYAQEKKCEIEWTVFRPGHIYGPGFLLGCFPEHSRQKDLAEHIRAGKPVRLVGGGKLRTQPVYVRDLAESMLDCVGNRKTYGQIFNIGGPKAVENRYYYECIGQLVGRPVLVEEIPDEGYLESHPEYTGHLCERVYTMEKLRKAGVAIPSTSLKKGLGYSIFPPFSSCTP